jgi:two-component system, OmpR family, response regulator
VKILVIEGDPETAEYVVSGLTEEGHFVVTAATGEDGLRRAADESFDLLIVDHTLPGLDGLSLVKTLRGGGKVTPVLFLTTLGGIDDRIASLNAGGDDYLVKPFPFAELAARVIALVRRPTMAKTEAYLHVADLELDRHARTLRRGGELLELQAREFRLLEYLMLHAEQVVTRTMLLENVWDFHFDPHTKIVETQISHLRSKIAKGIRSELIHTVRGVGYCFRVPG